MGTGEPETWDFISNPTAALAVLPFNVVEPLIVESDDGLSFEPYLAESFELSADGLEYRFKLRSATFHDGTPLSADDVVYSLNLHRKSNVEATKAAFAPFKSAEVVNDDEVIVLLSERSQAFTTALATRVMIVADGSNESEAIGTGPFSFGDFRSGVGLTMPRFDDYWGNEPFLKTATWRWIPDPAVAANSIRAGDIDVLTWNGAMDVSVLDSIDQDGTHKVAYVPGDAIQYLLLSKRIPAFDDERVRQAVAHAIDRDELNAGLGLEQGAEPTCALVAPADAPWATDQCPYAFDPERSKELLAEAGVQNPTIPLRFIAAGNSPTRAEIMASQLQRVGINVELQGLESGSYVDKILVTRELDFGLTPLGGNGTLEVWTCAGNPVTGDCSPEYDELLAAADAATDRSEWADLRRQAVEVLAERAYVIPERRLDLWVVLPEELDGHLFTQVKGEQWRLDAVSD